MSNSIKVAVQRKWTEADGICGLQLAILDGGALPAFTAGAHIDIEIKPGLVRQYSLCGQIDDRDSYQVVVLRDPQSRGGSEAIVEQVDEGAVVTISSPRNHFALDSEAPFSVLIAGGIGITPILSMAETLLAEERDFVLHYTARSRSRAALLRRLERSGLAEKVRLHFDDGVSDQRIDLEQIVGRRPDGAHLYVCGPMGLIDATLALAVRCGWPPAALHREVFTVAAPPAATGGEATFQVVINSSGVALDVPAGRAITDVLADAGICILTSCEQGVCGTCLTGVIEGTPDHRDFCLQPEEHARNDQMALCCSRSKTSRIVLDL